MSRASCGRTQLKSARKASKRACGARLLAAGRAVSCFRVRCMYSCRPFCLDFPGAMRSIAMPSLSRQTASFQRP